MLFHADKSFKYTNKVFIYRIWSTAHITIRFFIHNNNTNIKVASKVYLLESNIFGLVAKLMIKVNYFNYDFYSFSTFNTYGHWAQNIKIKLVKMYINISKYYSNITLAIELNWLIFFDFTYPGT